MSEWEDKLQAVLSNPEELSRLSEMASRLMGGLGGGEAPAKDAPESGGASRGGQLPPLIGRLMERFRSGGGTPLVEGVAPYLDEERRRRLEKAMRLASTARLAGTALEEMGGLDGL